MSKFNQMTTPKLRMAYQHLSGELYVVWGCASILIDKNNPEEKDVVVMTRLSDGEPFYTSLKNFFDKHPVTQEPRFQLVIPK